MFCPSCNHSLIPVTIHTDEGGRFQVNHCESCGGNWFDRYEINRIPYHEVLRLTNLTTRSLNKETVVKEYKECPIDSLPLVKFTGDSVPYHVAVWRCLSCAGIFVEQKDLIRFKDEQRRKINLFKHLNYPFPALAAVFIPLLFAGVLLLSTFLSVSRLKESQDNQIKARELLTGVQAVNINSTTIGMIFTTGTPIKTEISYFSNPLIQKTLPVSEAAKTVHSVILKNLDSGTTYKYQIILKTAAGESISSATYSFTTL